MVICGEKGLPVRVTLIQPFTISLKHTLIYLFMSFQNLILYSWQHWRCFQLRPIFVLADVQYSVPEPAGKGALAVARTEAEETGTVTRSLHTASPPRYGQCNTSGHLFCVWNAEWHTNKEDNIYILVKMAPWYILELPAGILAINSNLNSAGWYETVRYPP